MKDIFSQAPPSFLLLAVQKCVWEDPGNEAKMLELVV